jgi:hypothetical protein
MPLPRDYTGIKFGKLTAICFSRSVHSKRLWIFECECGTRVERSINAVYSIERMGSTPMCPCCKKRLMAEVTRNKHDFTGERFGKLTAVEPTDRRSGRQVIWRFVCDCGTFIERPAATLATIARQRQRAGKPFVPSCGGRECSPMFLEGNRAAFNRVYLRYKKDAERRNLPFTLTEEDVQELISAPCHYCGQQPAQVAYPSRNVPALEGDILLRNGIDRIQSSIGYIQSNVVPCCKQCNRAKSDMPADEFLLWIQQAYLHNFG